MTTTETVRQMLGAADATRDPYGVAAGAAKLMHTPELAGEATQYYLRALQTLRLNAASFRLLGTPVQPGAAGLIPWTSRARRFANNLKCLESHLPQGAASVADAARNLPLFELHHAADGNYQVLDTRQPVANGWVGGLANHKAAANAWQFDRSKPSMPLPIAFDGLGFGWPLLRVLETTANSYLNYSCAVYVVESEPIILAMLFHMHDFGEMLEGERTRWFVGNVPAALLAEYKQALLTHRTWTLPGQFVRCQVHARPGLELEKATADVRTAREAKRVAANLTIREQYAAKDAAFWANRFTTARAGGDPLRVLGITSRYTTVLQHSMRELRAAAESAGAVFETAMEPDDHSLENPFVEKIAELKPDLIVQISRMRYENPHLPREVPFLTWDQDNLPCMRTREAGASLDALTYVAGHGAIFGYGHLEWPAANCIFCQPAGAAHRYSATPVRPDLLSLHACDISYISNASGTPQTLHAQLRERWAQRPAAVNLFDTLCEQILAESQGGKCWDDISLRKLVTHPPKGIPLEDPGAINEMVMDLHRHADRCFRHATLAWISRWCSVNGKIFRLYGNGWKDHPEFAKWAAGVAEPGEQLQAIYQASRINLQLIESGFIHSRALDGLAAGGFFLTRHVPADGEDAATLRDIHLLGKWVVEHSPVTPQDLERAPAEVQARWKKTLAHHPWEPAHALKVLRVWADTPPALVAFPMLPEISFHDEAGFGPMASRYLGDDSRRQSLAAEMRRILLHQFSYDSRWNQFIAAVTEGLCQAASRGG